jgi:hypothetical protein
MMALSAQRVIVTTARLFLQLELVHPAKHFINMDRDSMKEGRNEISEKQLCALAK